MSVGGRSGFTLVETLVVALLGVFLILALYGTVVSSSRTYALQETWARDGQMSQSGSDVLFRDLREVSPRDGDLVRMGSRSLQIRAARRLALVCQVLRLGERPRLRARSVGAPLEDGDSVTVLFDNDPTNPTDDVWHTAVVADLRGGRRCGGMGGAYDLTLEGLPEAAPRIGLMPGAPVRSFVHVTYRLRERGGEGELVRVLGGGDPRRVVAPLEPDSGLHFAYLDPRGEATNVASEVVQVEVTLRGSASGGAGPPGVGPFTARIHARN